MDFGSAVAGPGGAGDRAAAGLSEASYNAEWDPMDFGSAVAGLVEAGVLRFTRNARPSILHDKCRNKAI